jgi:hypothetical protein
MPGKRNRGFGRQVSEPVETGNVELDAVRPADGGRHDVTQREGDGGAIPGGRVVERVGKDQPAAGRIVLDNQVRMAGDMLSDMARHEARHHIIISSDRPCDDQRDLLAAIKLGHLLVEVYAGNLTLNRTDAKAGTKLDKESGD